MGVVETRTFRGPTGRSSGKSARRLLERADGEGRPSPSFATRRGELRLQPEDVEDRVQQIPDDAEQAASIEEAGNGAKQIP
jgi:hypothetical protein